MEMQKFTSNFKNYVNYYTDDSVNFLNNFNEPIDLLYLDSFDGHNKIKHLSIN